MKAQSFLFFPSFLHITQSITYIHSMLASVTYSLSLSRFPHLSSILDFLDSEGIRWSMIVYVLYWVQGNICIYTHMCAYVQCKQAYCKEKRNGNIRERGKRGID